MRRLLLIIGICAAAALVIFAPESAFSLPSAAVVGVFAALLLHDRAFSAGATISVGIIVAATLTGLFLEAIFRDGGDFTFDHERGLVVAGVVFYAIVCLLLFWMTWLICRSRAQRT
jgi:uncharacterized membrane protein YdbT with pleckstrin-like domain